MTVRHDASDLGAVGAQLRYRGPTPGAYKVPLGVLRSWATHNPRAKAVVHAVTHHGWHTGGTMLCSDGPSRAHDLSAEAVRTGVMSPACFTPGERVGPQLAACMTTLATMGAPRSALDELWGCYTGPS